MAGGKESDGRDSEMTIDLKEKAFAIFKSKVKTFVESTIPYAVKIMLQLNYPPNTKIVGAISITPLKYNFVTDKVFSECAFCGKDTENFAVFVPKSRKLFKKLGNRYIIYFICDDCLETLTQKDLEEFEDKVLSELKKLIKHEKITSLKDAPIHDFEVLFGEKVRGNENARAD